ncbi:hypothetical protein HHX47_DHR5000789, partial [Lentinula edodes]
RRSALILGSFAQDAPQKRPAKPAGLHQLFHSDPSFQQYRHLHSTQLVYSPSPPGHPCH